MSRLMFAFAAAALLGQVTPAQAGHHCRQCGQSCCKVCRLERKVTKVTTFKYCLQCEDICLHGPSKCVGTKTVCDCQGCAHCEKVMQPTCGKVKTIAKLVKIPVVEEKCGWHCVVVNRCCGGCNNCTAENREATEAETQLAVQEAERLGILPVSAELPVEVTIADAVPAAEPVFAAPPVVEVKNGSLRTFGSLFVK
jgi:hypothetical protein